MASWPSARSRSRTTSPPRHRGTGRSSRSSTSTNRPPQQSMSLPSEVTNYRPSRWPAPERHVLAIINFQDLADIATRIEFTPNNVDYLDAECRTHLGAIIEEISLFTWCRHFDYREIYHRSPTLPSYFDSNSRHLGRPYTGQYFGTSGLRLLGRNSSNR